MDLESVIKAWAQVCPCRDTQDHVYLTFYLQNSCDFFFKLGKDCLFWCIIWKLPVWLSKPKIFIQKIFHFSYLSRWKGSLLFPWNQCNTVCFSLSALLVESGYMKTLGHLFPNSKCLRFSNVRKMSQDIPILPSKWARSKSSVYLLSHPYNNKTYFEWIFWSGNQY